jgi:putative tryptophan/tyrosine transport system substrate-binding protein
MQFDQPKRREFIFLLGGAAVAWPLAAAAQPTDQVRRLAILMAGADDADSMERIAAVRKGLRDLGWAEGHNLQFTIRWGGGSFEGIRAAASEVVTLKPEVIMVNGTRAVRALKGETRNIPIVFAGLTDPVEEGFVDSLARPGGNITGFTNFQTSLIGKLLEMLKEISPRISDVALVQNPDDPAIVARTRFFEAAAAALSLRPLSAPVREAADIEGAIAPLGRGANGGFVVVPSATVVVHRNEIIAAAARHRVPAVYPFRSFVTSGGLLSYGADILDLTRRSASHVDRILKGETPADLPVQTPVKYELAINLKAANALGLDVPPALLVRADEVIE